MWTAFALRLLGVRVPLLSISFHFPRLPKGMRLHLLKWAFSRVERFQVHSEVEKERYARHFGIPVDRFDLVRWGVEPSTVHIDDAPPPIDCPYICALGKDGRDYGTLIEAMKRLPELTLVLVAQPYNLTGVDIPNNVKIYCDIPRDEALNILKHSQFMALPLEDDDTSCGHITLVSAMFFRKSIIATNSSGIADYFPLGYDAPRVAAGDVDGWVKAIRTMADDRARQQRCAAAGEKFVYQYCSHDAAYRGTMELFRKAGILIG
jgi:glycosyltransferase involved in cell wall biosynthesis